MADITPITREEFYLAKAGGQDVPAPSAVTREEYYLEKLTNDNVVVPTPVTRREKFLYFACGGEIDLPSEEKMTRLERLIAKAGGMDVSTPTAVTRLEKLWANVEGGGWKTITGTLPLTFRTSETALRSWTIYGNNTPHIASSTAVLPLTFTTTEDKLRDWEIRGNDAVYEGQRGVGERTVNLAENIENGSWSPTGFTKQVNPIRCRVSNVIDIDEGVIYTIFGETTGSISGMYLVQFKQDDGTSVSESGWKSFGTSVSAPTGATKATVIIALADSSACQSTDFANIMFVKGSTAPSTYVPFGYEIPISVNGTPQTFYIGNTPLRAGQSISKTSTGVDIATTEGENTISTTLYNKPETAISYVDFVGVGEKSGNDWQIPLTISDGTNTTSVNVPIDAPLTEGESVTDELTISTFEGANTIDTSLTNKPNMSITYKGG